MNWKRKFRQPIHLKNGKTLATLEDAAKFIGKLPREMGELPEWDHAIKALISAGEGRGSVQAAWDAVWNAVFIRMMFDKDRMPPT